MTEGIYIIDNIGLFNPKVTASSVYHYNDLDRIAGKCHFPAKVYFITSDIFSILDITEKVKKIFMLIKPALLILQDDKQTKTLTIFHLLLLMKQKKADEALIPMLLDKSKEELDRIEKNCVKGRYNPNAVPVYLKTTMSYGVQSGGMVAHSTGVLKGLEKKFCNVRVYTTDYIAKVIRKAEIHHLSMQRFHDFPELRNLYFNFSSYKKILKIQKNEIPSFVYQRYSLNNFTGLRLANYFKVPFVLEFNSSAVWTSRNWGCRLKYEKITERIENINLDKADLIVCVSDELKDTLIQKGIDESKILVNYNGVDAENYVPGIKGDEVRKKYNMNNKTVIGFSGSFGKWHGAEKLAEGYGNLIRDNEDYRENTCLFLIGEGETLPLVKRVAKRLNVDKCIVYAGNIPFEDMPLYLGACDILVAPHIRNRDGSEFFGSPTKLFEYMAMGKAIAASNLNQIGNILTDYETALLFEPGDTVQMEGILKILTEDEKLRKKLGKNARAEVISKYTWDIHVDKILERLNKYNSGGNRQ